MLLRSVWKGKLGFGRVSRSPAFVCVSAGAPEERCWRGCLVDRMPPPPEEQMCTAHGVLPMEQGGRGGGCGNSPYQGVGGARGQGLRSRDALECTFFKEEVPPPPGLDPLPTLPSCLKKISPVPSLQPKDNGSPKSRAARDATLAHAPVVHTSAPPPPRNSPTSLNSSSQVHGANTALDQL